MKPLAAIKNAYDSIAKSFGTLPASFSSTDRIDPRDEDGMYLFTYLMGNAPQFNTYGADIEKVRIVFSNPAVLKVFKLQCDLFSLGKIYVYQNEKEVSNDPVLKLFKQPNPFQSQSQWLWDMMFWNMIGNGYCYMDSNIAANIDNKLYFLDPAKMEFPQSMKVNQDKLILSSKGVKNVMDSIITYRYADGTSMQFPFSQITTISDLTNGTGNWFKSKSCIDALYKVVCNSDAALDARNINIKMSGKFMVAGQQDPKNTTQLPLSDTEKEDIETKMNGRKKIHAVKSMVDIKRFVENMANLELGKAYQESYYIIGSMYGIPKDVLEAYLDSGATYENQEKSVGRHISYSLQPKGNDFFESLAKRFGYTDAGKSIEMSWDHLPFMQVFETDRSKAQKFKVDAFCLLLDQGVALEECNQYLDLDFKTGKANAKPTTAINTGTGNNA